ncbi:unnamed protein product [Penicillium camemberti]|uniref:Str. FM013 n=1 Tax=Penicillium camemberti (strain FM 013) TaxID=1429867 RepID=A0A0G4PB92_PENC3|nr:unnamed protein product [Penicillium camemberti]
MLVEQYFINIHPLRGCAFIYRPSFLQRLDGEISNHQNHALLHVICALGAQLILEIVDRVTIESLMATVLLYDHAVRLGNFSNAFILSGLTIRMTQVLQINLEYNTDILCQDTDNGLLVIVK